MSGEAQVLLGKQSSDDFTGSLHGSDQESLYSLRDKSKALGILGSNRDDTFFRNPSIGRAAFLIRDAAMDVDVEHPAAGAYDAYREFSFLNATSIACHRLCSFRPFLALLHIAGWLLIVLTFIEPPIWCQPTGDKPNQSCEVLLEARGTPSGYADEENAEYYPNSHSMLLSSSQSRLIESICISFIFMFLFLRIGRDGMSLTRYLRPGRAQLNRISQLMALAVIANGLITKNTFYNPYARLIIVMSFNNFNFQRELRDLIDVLPRALQILSLLGVLIFFYGWFGAVMFVNTEEGAESFSGLIESMWTLWICVTTVNYPDVMMPAYNDNRWVALYFVSFMSCTFFFLMNLILAVVVNQYNETSAARTKERVRYSEECLRKAFKLLDPYDRGWVERESLMSTFGILNDDFPEFRTVSEEEKSLIFAILDRDGKSRLSEDEFMDLSHVLMLDFVRMSDYSTWVEKLLPSFVKTPIYQSFCSLVNSTAFEYTIDLILVANAICVAVQSYPALAYGTTVVDPSYKDGFIDTEWEIAETVFTALYTFEIGCKVTVLGWRQYCENKRNVFDFSVTVLAIISSVVIYYPNAFSDSRLVRMVVMIRVLRVVRHFEMFDLIFRIAARVMPAATSVVLLLFFSLYFYATLGLHRYGGMITRDPSNELSFLLLNNAFSENAYWANNFNDMLSGMNVLFNFLVINNWNQQEIGMEAVTQAKWIRWFFITFHLIGVALVNNLVIAFVIEAFLEQMTLLKAQDKDKNVGKGETIVRGGRTTIDAADINPSVKGSFRVGLRRTSTGHTQSGQESIRKLFSERF